MLIPFTKMQACGNDYIYLDGFTYDLSGIDLPKLARKMCRRSFSVGADGMVLISPSDKADGAMRIFNADGSEGRQCGNALRCVGKLLFERGYAGGDTLSVEAASGVCTLFLNIENGRVKKARVALGRAVFDADRVPAVTAQKRICGEAIDICGREAMLTLVNVGNPHAVLIFESIDDISPSLAAWELGEKMGEGAFPEGINVEIVEVLGENKIKMRVFERGSGETLSCGTGAAGAAASAVQLGLCDFGVPIEVMLRGGTLFVTVEKDFSLFLAGDAVTVFEGVYEDGAFAQ